MSREAHVRFWESAGLQCPALLNYLNGYANATEARTSLTRYFSFYNERRSHQSLEYRTPDEVYFGALAASKQIAA